MLDCVVWLWQVLRRLSHRCDFHARLRHSVLALIFQDLIFVVRVSVFLLFLCLHYLVLLVVGLLIAYLEWLVERHVVLLFVLGFVWRVSCWVHGSHDVLHLDAVGSSLRLKIASLVPLFILNAHIRPRILLGENADV